MSDDEKKKIICDLLEALQLLQPHNGQTICCIRRVFGREPVIEVTNPHTVDHQSYSLAPDTLDRLVALQYVCAADAPGGSARSKLIITQRGREALVVPKDSL